MTNYNKIEIVQGDTYHATIKISNGSSEALGTVTFYASCGGDEGIEIIDNELTIPAETTSTWTPGSHTYSIVATGEGTRKTLVYKNTLTVLANPVPESSN